MKRLKEEIVKEIEFRILSEIYKAGEKIPTERDLATEFAVSRPVIHEALLILEARGLIIIRPRHGAVANDFRKEGTLDLLSSLMCHTDEDLNKDVLNSLYRVRALLESDSALLASKNMSKNNLQELNKLINLKVEGSNPLQMAERDFKIHHLIALFSGNITYPLLLNSLKPVYMEFLQTFYSRGDKGKEINLLQLDLYKALQEKDGIKAAAIMKQLSSFTID